MSFVAISNVFYPPCLKGKVCQPGLAMLLVAKQQPGFISISFHHAGQKSETMMY
jgi:hypothetical protein